MLGLLLAALFLLALAVPELRLRGVAGSVADLRLWVSAHDDELDELAEDERERQKRQELLSRRRAPVSKFTDVL